MFPLVLTLHTDHVGYDMSDNGKHIGDDYGDCDINIHDSCYIMSIILP
ncbi:MAG: hypothetical protein LBV42_03695 [Methanobrevibacter sp.]|nr:hypothetical protein [Methanobrevibacter sp.]